MLRGPKRERKGLRLGEIGRGSFWVTYFYFYFFFECEVCRRGDDGGGCSLCFLNDCLISLCCFLFISRDWKKKIAKGNADLYVCSLKNRMVFNTY